MDISVAERDHPMLDRDALESLFRRLHTFYRNEQLQIMTVFEHGVQCLFGFERIRSENFFVASQNWFKMDTNFVDKENELSLCPYLNVRYQIFLWWKRAKKRLDYRRENGPASASCLTFPNRNLLSSIEAVVNRGIRSWKKHLSD